MPTTVGARLKLPAPNLDEVPDAPAAFTALINALDPLPAIDDQGVLSNRPVSTPASPGVRGRYYYVTGDPDPTQNGVLWRDYGTGWTAVGAEQAGVIKMFGGATPPSGYLLCDGGGYLRTGYPALFGVIGTQYGAPDGTHFNVPDLRGRVPVGVAPAGGHSEVDTLGANDSTSLPNRRPRHGHTVNDPGHYHGIQVDHTEHTSGGIGSVHSPSGSIAGTYSTLPATTGIQVGPSGGTVDTPAYIVINFIIKT